MQRLVASLALGLALLAPGAAHAADWYTGGRQQQVPDESWIVSVDSYVTITSTGSAFAASSATLALSGSARESGARLKLEGRGGKYEYRTNAGQRIEGQQVDGAAMVGYEWVWSRGSLAAYLGANVQSNELSPADPTNSVVGEGIGAKASIDLYANPTDLTMVAATGSYSTLHASYYARLRTGVAIFDRVYIGPEFASLGDDFYRQWRIGAFVSGGRAGPFEYGLSGGYLRDAVQGSGGYGTIDLRMAF